MTLAAPAFTPATGRALLRYLFDAALRAVDPLPSVPRHLPPRPRGSTGPTRTSNIDLRAVPSRLSEARGPRP